MVTRRELQTGLCGILLPFLSGCITNFHSDDQERDNNGNTPDDYASSELFTYIEVKIYANEPEDVTIVESSDNTIYQDTIFTDLFETVKSAFPDEMEESRSVYYNQNYRLYEYDLHNYSESEIKDSMKIYEGLPQSGPDGFPNGVYVEHNKYIMQIRPLIEDS